MSQSKSAVTSAAAESKLEDILLTCGMGDLVRPNYLKWLTNQKDVLGEEYGYGVSFLESGEAYVVPAVIEADYLPAAPHGLTAASIQALNLEAQKERMKVVNKLKARLINIFHALWATVSGESRTIVVAHEGYANALLTKNPVELFRCIKETHLTHVHGDGVQAGVMDVVLRTNQFNSLMQGETQDIATFLTVFQNQLDILAGLGVAAATQQAIALQFLMKLDPLRYGEMINTMTNDAARNIPYPATLQAAYKVAKDWRSKFRAKTVPGGYVQAGSAFMLADDVRIEDVRRVLMTQMPVERAQPKPPAAVKKAGGNSEPEKTAWTRKCYLCKKEGHFVDQCPDNPYVPGTTTLKGEGGTALFTNMGDEEDEEDAYNAAMLYGAMV